MYGCIIEPVVVALGIQVQVVVGVASAPIHEHAQTQDKSLQRVRVMPFSMTFVVIICIISTTVDGHALVHYFFFSTIFFAYFSPLILLTHLSMSMSRLRIMPFSVAHWYCM